MFLGLCILPYILSIPEGQSFSKTGFASFCYKFEKDDLNRYEKGAVLCDALSTGRNISPATPLKAAAFVLLISSGRVPPTRLKVLPVHADIGSIEETELNGSYAE